MQKRGSGCEGREYPSAVYGNHAALPVAEKVGPGHSNKHVLAAIAQTEMESGMPSVCLALVIVV